MNHLTIIASFWLLSTASVYGQTASSASTDTLRASGVKTNANLVASLKQSPDHSTLLQLLEASGLTKQAAGKQQYTIFAPTNVAFSILSESFLRELLLPSSKQRLIRFLAYHVVKGRLTTDQLKDAQTLTNLTGQVLVVHKQGNYITVDDGRGTVADVTQANIRTTNGIVYSINKVLQKVIVR